MPKYISELTKYNVAVEWISTYLTKNPAISTIIVFTNYFHVQISFLYFTVVVYFSEHLSQFFKMKVWGETNQTLLWHLWKSSFYPTNSVSKLQMKLIRKLCSNKNILGSSSLNCVVSDQNGSIFPTCDLDISVKQKEKIKEIRKVVSVIKISFYLRPHTDEDWWRS